MKIQLITNNPDSWIVPYGLKLKAALEARGHQCVYIASEEEVVSGDILVFLSYEKIFKGLHLNKHNLVIHESDLPKGKGMSPLTWQVLEGKNRIPVTLLEATEAVDSGIIYDQVFIDLEGHELLAEMKHLQGEATIQLVLEFVDSYPPLKFKEQRGESTYYPRRRAGDSVLDVNKTIAEQFNLLRVCDNERYPAFFHLNGHTYYLKIEKKYD